MASRRAIAAVSIAALVCVATFAVLSYEDSATEIVAEEGGAHSGHEVDVLKNIIHLKAYCLAAWDDARVLANQSGGKYASITDFVLSYGQEGSGVARGGRKAKIGNIVMEYAATMGALRIKYPKGVNKYILDTIDYTVRHDVNGVTFQKNDMSAFGNGGANGRKFGHLVAIRNKAIGLTDRPQVVVLLAAKYPDYLHFKTVASTQADNADAIAATMFLKSKGAGHYQSFLQREVAKVQRKMRHDFGVVSKAAYGAEEEAFEKAYEADREAFFHHVQVQTPAGMAAADKSAAGITWVPPTMEQMKAIAAKHSAKFLEEFKKKMGSPAKLIKTMVDESGGVKVYLRTSGQTDAQSTMKPKIEFVGKERSMSGVVRSVPGRDLTFVQHFGTANPIGKIESVKITGTGTGLKWNVASLKVRVGGRDATVVKMMAAPKAPEVVQDGEHGMSCSGVEVHSFERMNDWHNFKSEGRKAKADDCFWQATHKYAGEASCFKFSPHGEGTCKLFASRKGAYMAVSTADFWVKSGETVELLPDPDAFNKAEFTQQGCMGWRATDQCDAHGEEEPENNKGCTDEIDSSMSGYCKCDTGVTARVECGHATFTCDEMCKE